MEAVGGGVLVDRVRGDGAVVTKQRISKYTVPTNSRGADASLFEGTGCFLTVWLIWALIALAFWAGVIYVVLHFVLKYW